MPAVLGRAIDRGVAAKDTSQLRATGPSVMLLIGLVQAVTGIMRHRFAVTNWLTAAYRTVQLVGRQVVHLGGTLPRKVSTGEVVAIGTTDLSHIGQVMDVSRPLRRGRRVVPPGVGDPAARRRSRWAWSC